MEVLEGECVPSWILLLGESWILNLLWSPLVVNNCTLVKEDHLPPLIAIDNLRTLFGMHSVWCSLNFAINDKRDILVRLISIF